MTDKVIIEESAQTTKKKIQKEQNVQPYRILPKPNTNVLFAVAQPKASGLKRLGIVGRGRNSQSLDNAITIVAEKNAYGTNWGKIENNGGWVNLELCFKAA